MYISHAFPRYYERHFFTANLKGNYADYGKKKRKKSAKIETERKQSLSRRHKIKINAIF